MSRYTKSKNKIFLSTRVYCSFKFPWHHLGTHSTIPFHTDPSIHPSIPPRLYVKARHLGYQRGKRSQHPSTSLLQIDNVTSTKDADFYCGKRVAYVYRAKSTKTMRKTISGKYTKVKCIWGKITRPHGNSGTVRAKFAVPLPPRTFGATCRVMLYPSSI